MVGELVARHCYIAGYVWLMPLEGADGLVKLVRGENVVTRNERGMEAE